MDRQQRELDVLVRARYPIVFLVTWEETRAARMLTDLAANRGKQIYFWTVTTGITEGPGAGDPATRDPQAALEFVAQTRRPALFVLKDFHPFMQDARIIRRLRDLVQDLKSSFKTLLILSPVLVVPVELEKDLVVLDFELPRPEELGELLDGIASMARTHGKFRAELDPEGKERLVQAAIGMTLSEAENAFARAIVTDSILSIDDVDLILQEKKQIIRKSRLLEYFEAPEEFRDIGGLDLLKGWLRGRAQAFSNRAQEFGLPQPKGILLLGVQGCGKSLTCKAVSSLWKMPLLRLDMGTIFGGMVGQSEENMRRAIRTAESISPVILWLDELEKGLAGTQSSSFSDAGTTARVFSTFLTWLQEKQKPVFVAATANNIELLPPEILRKGRLDEIFFIDLPTTRERQEIFAIHLRKRRRDPALFDLAALAGLADGFSGAEIEQVVVSGLHKAFPEDRDLRQPDLVEAIQDSVPLSRTMREEIERLREWARTRARPAARSSELAGAGVHGRLER